MFVWNVIFILIFFFPCSADKSHDIDDMDADNLLDDTSSESRGEYLIKVVVAIENAIETYVFVRFNLIIILL